MTVVKNKLETKQIEEVTRLREIAEPSIWTKRMLGALVMGGERRKMVQSD